MPECFCGEQLTDDGTVHTDTGSPECFPDEPDVPDLAQPA